MKSKPITKPKHNPKSSMFVTQFSDTNVALNFRGKPTEEFYSYGDAYHRAGMSLFKAHFSRGTFSDLDVLPVAFLLRHAAELYLKAVVRRGNTVLSWSGKPEVPVRQTHRLTLLLEDIRPIFDFMKWSWDADKDGFRSFEDFRKCIGDLERDDVLGIDDSQADMWRYPVRKRDDAPHLPIHFHFDAGEFVVRLDLLLRMLSGAAIGLDWHLDYLGDQAAYEAENRERPDYEPDYYEPQDYEPDYEPPDYEPPDYE
jgi:hypothetical protein